MRTVVILSPVSVTNYADRHYLCSGPRQLDSRTAAASVLFQSPEILAGSISSEYPNAPSRMVIRMIRCLFRSPSTMWAITLRSEQLYASTLLTCIDGFDVNPSTLTLSSPLACARIESLSPILPLLLKASIIVRPAGVPHLQESRYKQGAEKTVTT